MGQSNDPDRLEATVWGQKFGLATKNLISVLLLVFAMSAGYVVWQDFRHLFITHTGSLERLSQRQEVNVQLFTDVMQRYERRMAEQTREFQRLLWIHDYNTGRPLEDRLPLVVAPESVEPLLPPRPR